MSEPLMADRLGKPVEPGWHVEAFDFVAWTVLCENGQTIPIDVVGWRGDEYQKGEFPLNGEDPEVGDELSVLYGPIGPDERWAVVQAFWLLTN